MLDRFKEEALNIVGRFADSGKGIDLLANPSLQAALTRALTLQTELRDHWERQVEGVAKSLNLVSKRDVLKVKRQVRDLENLVATLEHQLKQQTLRTKRAEKDLASARSDAKKTAKPVKTAAKKAPAKKAPAKKAPAKKTVAKKTVAKKTVAKKAPAKKTVAKKAPAKNAVGKKAPSKQS